MPKYAAFLRGINIGGRRVKMTALQKAFESLGFTDVKTVSAGGKLTQIAGLELTHPQQSYSSDLVRSEGDDLTYAGRQDGEAAAGVARRRRLDS